MTDNPNMVEFGIRCISRFIDWLYESGVDPDSMTRGKLLETYVDFLKLNKTTSEQKSKVISLTQERAKRRRTPLSPSS